jgi:hypothetical protein
MGDNIPCERGFANHASASATLPVLHPMSTSGGGAGTTAGRIRFFHRFATIIRSWLRGEMNLRSALIHSKQC